MLLKEEMQRISHMGVLLKKRKGEDDELLLAQLLPPSWVAQGSRLQLGWEPTSPCSPRRALQQHPTNQPAGTDVGSAWEQMCWGLLPCCLPRQAARSPASTTLGLGMERAQHGQTRGQRHQRSLP